MLTDIIAEQYLLMIITKDGDYELCFDKEGNQIISTSLDEIIKEKREAEENNYYDYPLVIVRETQQIIE